MISERTMSVLFVKTQIHLKLKILVSSGHNKHQSPSSSIARMSKHFIEDKLSGKKLIEGVDLDKRMENIIDDDIDYHEPSSLGYILD